MAYIAPALGALRDELTTRYPRRALPDGWIGDTAHAARVSDHNPTRTPPDIGIVRALDVLIDGIDVDAVLDELIGDPRVWYVIHNGHIWSRTYGWRKKVYTGDNKHPHHIHVSLTHTHAACYDRSPWFTVAAARARRPLPSAAGSMGVDLLKPGSVNAASDAVNAFLGLGGKTYTAKTAHAAAKWGRAARAGGTRYARTDGLIDRATYNAMGRAARARR